MFLAALNRASILMNRVLLKGQGDSLGSTWLGFQEISVVPQEMETYHCCEEHIFRQLQGVVGELCTSRMVWA